MRRDKNFAKFGMLCVNLMFAQFYQRELASLYLELGVTKSALEVYERLQLWEDVINCYISLGRFEKVMIYRLYKRFTTDVNCSKS
jgi:hypothetical protein